MMHLTVELVLKSYMPKHLEPGMWFITKLNQGTVKEHVEIWALEKVPLEPLEEFVTKHGAPVEPYLIYNDDEVMATPHQIGWWDEGEHSDELRDIELKDINTILNDYEGYVDIEVEEIEHEVFPIIYENKVTMCAAGEYEEDGDWEYDDEDSELCSFCGGSGEGPTPESKCSVCKGMGEVSRYEEDDEDDRRENY